MLAGHWLGPHHNRAYDWPIWSHLSGCWPDPLLQRLATVVPLQIGPGAEQQEAKELLQASKKREEAM